MALELGMVGNPATDDLKLRCKACRVCAALRASGSKSRLLRTHNVYGIRN